MFSEDKETNRLQKTSLDIFKEFIKVCEDNNLCYFLSGGSLLGSVRHNGFIPWDDDIDVAMPRKDYEKLIEIARHILPSHLELEHYSIRDDKRPITHHVQIVDKRTSLTKDWTTNKNEISVWIDIFPLDGMPKNKTIRILHFVHYYFWWLVMQVRWFKDNVDIMKERPFYQKLFINIIKHLPDISTKRLIWILKKMDNIAKKYSFNNSDYVCSFHGSYKTKEIMKKKWYEETCKVQFENIICDAPKGYKNILKQHYGDYDIIPSEKDRTRKHKSTVIKL